MLKMLIIYMQIFCSNNKRRKEKYYRKVFCVIKMREQECYINRIEFESYKKYMGIYMVDVYRK